MNQPETVVAEAGQFIAGLVQLAGLTLEVSEPRQDGDTFTFDIHGEDQEMLLEDGARLLYALNHLVNQVFYRRARPANFVLDCQQYRRTRALELELLALKAAERAEAMRMQVALQPMTSSERRIIHLTLAEHTKVRTESEGSGAHRHVLILPN